MPTAQPITKLNASTIVPLVAEPDSILRRQEIELVKKMGFNPIETGMGTHAWRTIKRNNIGLIVAGWEMPQISGLAILKLVRFDEDLFEIPFVLVVQDVTRAMVMEAAESGVNAIVLLPLNPRVLEAKINESLIPDDDPDKAKAQEQFDQGVKLMEEGNFEEAAKSFEKIMEVYKAAEVYYNQGYIHSAKGEFPQALKCFRKAIRINHSFARAHRMMAECFTQMGDKAKAQESLSQAAEIYMSREMDANAEEVLNEVLKLNPDTINVYNSLGILYRRRGDFDKAIDQYKRALKVNPQDENIHYNLARTCYERQDFPQAHQVLCSALKINPEFAEASQMRIAIEKKGLISKEMAQKQRSFI
jgi:tetratricopeptide (TPR) repeat protein